MTKERLDEIKARGDRANHDHLFWKKLRRTTENLPDAWLMAYGMKSACADIAELVIAAERVVACEAGDCGRKVASQDADKWLTENMNNKRCAEELFEALEYVIEGMAPTYARIKHGREVLHKYKQQPSIMMQNAGWTEK